MAYIENQDHRYSRQSYTIGQDAQIKLSEANILVIGYNTLAQEIVKNLALIGIKQIDIFDGINIMYSFDKTGLYYPLDEENNIPLDDLRKLNPTIQINTINILDECNELDKNIIKKYTAILLINSNLSDAININKLTHKLNIPFIMCGVYGLMGYVFNDFGDTFTINDIDGENHEHLILENIDGKIMKFKDQHKLSKDDIIEVLLLDGTKTELKVYRKCSPITIELSELPNQDKSIYSKMIRKKISKIFKFEPLIKYIEENNKIKYIIADQSVEKTRSETLHKLHIAYNKYITEFGESPRSWSQLDNDIFEKYLDKNMSESEMMLAKKFSYTLKGNVLPFCSIIGGIASHEVLKIISHKYVPIIQWYYLDYLDLISDKEIESHNDLTNINFKTKTKYEGLVNVFGKKFLEHLQNKVPFVIGSGAIGCELIKNLGMIGVKQIYLTDPDHIEKSNLSRQFFFNDADIRQSKSETVAKKIKLMNPDTNINVYKQKMCEETEKIFNDDFHSKIDIYLNALDNVDARIYVDSQVLKYSKPLIDSGTMGSKGNIQVIIPHLTESYGNSKDPDEKTEIPICTIKSFPYRPEHTIQWARELFETEFNQIPNLLNKYKNYNLLDKINDSDSKILLKQLYKYKDFNLTSECYNKLLGTIYRENYYDNIKEIIDKYSKSENKKEFEDKKIPIYLSNTINLNDFLKYGYKLLNQIFGTNLIYSTEYVNINEIDNIEFNYDLENIVSENIIDILYPIINLIPNTFPIEFEKDDDELGHVQWIWLNANMRNIQYSISEIDLFETRRITGNIIPALITTTSIISGFQIMEYIRICKLYTNNKYLNKENMKDINLYKNRFVNLNYNYYDGCNPISIKFYELNNLTSISAWSYLITNFTNTNEIIKQIESETKKKVEFIVQDNTTIFDGDDINITELIQTNKIFILLENIPIGIPIFVK